MIIRKYEEKDLQQMIDIYMRDLALYNLELSQADLG